MRKKKDTGKNLRGKIEQTARAEGAAYFWARDGIKTTRVDTRRASDERNKRNYAENIF